MSTAECISDDGSRMPPGKPAAFDRDIRSAEKIRLEGNRLAGAKSLYLRQHAHNPVDWYPWGPEALERARSEDKPVFVSIGYSACHWCHVMEKEVFEDDSLAGFLNRHFISIKVDREERPDLDKSYMDALQIMTGSGGWPMSLFLTPELKPFFGGSYIPRTQFLTLITRIDELFREDRAQLESQARRVLDHLSIESARLPGRLDKQAIARVVATAKHNIDREWGGLRGTIKFPMPPVWSFLLHYHHRNHDPELAAAIRNTLDQIGSGGIHDQLGGGFHRYATEPTWLLPHFEKMLYDNAQLSGLYIEAAAIFDDDRYADIGRRTLDFMICEMSASGGGFFSSFDADSGGREGSYYLWTPAEITALAGERDGPPLAALLGVTAAGNFERRNILTRRADPAVVARRFGRDPLEVAGLFEKYRPRLLAGRSNRTPPALDRKLITAWNGLAISALARGYALFGNESYRRAAEQTAELLMTMHAGESGSLLRASYAGAAEHAAILDDYALLALGLIDLYQATDRAVQLERALDLLDFALDNFSHPDGSFYMTARGQLAPLGRPQDLRDGVAPSGNSAMLHALLSAASVTGSQSYRRLAESAIVARAGLMQRAGLDMAGWFDAALKLQVSAHEQAGLWRLFSDRARRWLTDPGKHETIRGEPGPEEEK